MQTYATKIEDNLSQSKEEWFNKILNSYYGKSCFKLPHGKNHRILSEKSKLQNLETTHFINQRIRKTIIYMQCIQRKKYGNINKILTMVISKE